MMSAGSNTASEPTATTNSPPLWLLAELTYRCPLQCPYCSNPVEMARNSNELTTEEWMSVLQRGRTMGAAQLGFSGGEPLLRDDLETLVAEARSLGYYTNLITSGLGLTVERVAALREAGLDHIQVSFQSSDPDTNAMLSGSGKAFEQKLKMARAVKEQGYPMVLNFVLHRHNIDQIATILELSESLNADYVELANTQYHGWALKNRESLMPTREQLKQAEAITNTYRETYPDGMRLYFVVPDYFEERPKPCMNGWGSMFITITPDGRALPCHSAADLPYDFPNVRETSLDEIWHHSEAFNLFRGNTWMREPCRSCPEKERDFGGCRCQAFLLTGNARNADPVCRKSPHRSIIDEALAVAQDQYRQPPPMLYRNMRNSRDIIATS